MLQAKLQCSVSWILDKAYRDNVPRELKEPFYETQDVRNLSVYWFSDFIEETFHNNYQWNLLLSITKLGLQEGKAGSNSLSFSINEINNFRFHNLQSKTLGFHQFIFSLKNHWESRRTEAHNRVYMFILKKKLADV